MHGSTREPGRCPGSWLRSTRAGLAARAVTVSRPSLDDVYLHHTGRAFQSDDLAGGTWWASRSRKRCF